MKKVLISSVLALSLFAGNLNLKVDNSDFKRFVPNQSRVISFAPVVKKVVPSVVNISTEKIVKTKIPEAFQKFFNDPFLKRFFDIPVPKTPKEQKEHALGSGVIISKDGYIVTNYHVVSGATKILVKLHDGRKVTAKLVGSDPKTDIAVIKIEADNLEPITIADSNDVEVGDIVLAVGDPFGLGETVTEGIVSGLNRSSVGLNDYENFIQTDAAINPGNSGGALVDLKGRLIGINSAILSTSGGNNGIGFAIPSNMMKFVVTSLIKNGKVVRGYLGVRISDIDSAKAKLYGIDHGVLINSVEPNSAASKAGLQAGDIIVEVDGKKVKNAAGLRNMIAFKGANAVVNLKVYRNGDYVTLKAKLKALKPKEITLKDTILNGIKLKEENRKVVVEDVAPNSLAALLGVEKGDEIVAIKTIKTKKWIKVNSLEELQKEIKGLKKGDALIKFRRGNEILILTF